MDNTGGVGGGGAHLYNENSMLTQNSNASQVANNDLDSLSNLLINSYEDDAAALDKYESEMEQNLNENLILEKEQSNQRLFQSFQTSACAVAQMFKDKSTQQSPGLSSWESFQNSAGAITVLYKDSLESCKVHMDLGIHLGQQRKLKDIINWIKKKKKRSIRKDELISFLIGKQYPSQNQMFNLFNQNNSTNPFNSNPGNLNTMSAHINTPMPPFPASNNRHRQQVGRNIARNNSVGTNANSNPTGVNLGQATTISGTTNNNMSIINPSINQLNLINRGDNSNGSNDSHAVETNADLATFREALIMHNRTRDTPLNRNPSTNNHHTSNHNSQLHLNNHNTHHHHHHSHTNNNQHSHCNTNQNPNATSQALNQGSTQPSPNTNSQAPNCDDLDCFFCEQIATHIEHKRSSANLNFDMESPTRKRSRFY